MPTVIPSTRLCITCNKYHLNAHPDSIPTLLRLGFPMSDILYLLQAGDEAALPENQPEKIRQIKTPDIANLRRLGFSDEQIESLTLDAQRLQREADLDLPSRAPSEETLRDATPAELEALQTFFDNLTEADLPTPEEIKRAKNRAKQRRWYERHHRKPNA